MSAAKGAEERIGEMFLKIGMEELIVLMAHEYRELSEVSGDYLFPGTTADLNLAIA